MVDGWRSVVGELFSARGSIEAELFLIQYCITFYILCSRSSDGSVQSAVSVAVLGDLGDLVLLRSQDLSGNYIKSDLVSLFFNGFSAVLSKQSN